jgi:hypothetical protein
MKIHRLLASILLLALIGAGCPPKNVIIPIAPPAAPKRIYDPGYGLSVMVPDDWQVTFRDGNPFLFAVAPGAGPSGPMMNVITETITQRLNPYDYLQANIITMRLSLQNMKIVRSGIELKAGVNMSWVQYTYPRGKQMVEAVSYAQTREYRAYVVTAMAPKEQFKKLEPNLRFIGQSLRIDPGR